jgi:cbb3-type cytochrome oxidase subunit 1
MSRATRLFLLSALVALLCASALHLLTLLGVGNAWAATQHLALFGWVTLMIMAVNYHTLPVFSARDFPDQRVALVQCGVQGLGLALTTAGLLAGVGALVVAGLLAELAAALLFVANVALLMRYGKPRPNRPPVPPVPDQQLIDRVGTRATSVAGICLPLSLLLLLLARVAPPARGEWWLAGEHAAALGWVMLMIMGVAFHVLPRFTGKGLRGLAWARAQLALHLAALLLLVAGLLLGLPLLFALGGAGVALALALFAYTVWPALQPLRQSPQAIPLTLKERRR